MKPPLDITGPSAVEIRISADGMTMWVNVDGGCCMRASRVKTLVVFDERPKPEPKIFMRIRGNHGIYNSLEEWQKAEGMK